MEIDYRIEPGHCWISGKPCFDIVAKYANDHPLAGHILRVGNALPEAWRVTLLLMDGKLLSLTIHQECIGLVESKLNEIWHTTCDSAVYSYLHAVDADHNADKDKNDKAHETTVQLFGNNPPIGVVSIIRWLDLQ